MTMVTEMQKALRSEVGSTIYGRGVDYVRWGRVRTWAVDGTEPDGSILLSGRVRGSKMYDAQVSYDPIANLFTELSCTCPYQYGCKHAVAIALSYIASYDNPSLPAAQSKTVQKKSSLSRSTPAPVSTPPPGMRDVRQALAELGIAADALPEKLINELLTFRTDAGTSDTVQQNTATHATSPALPALIRKKPFNPSKYAVFLHADRRYAPSLHLKGIYYEQTSITKLLADAELSPTERALLTYIKEHNGFSNSWNAPPVLYEPDELFRLIEASKLMVVCGPSYYATNLRQITIDTEPAPIRLVLQHFPNKHPYSTQLVRHEIILTQPDVPEARARLGKHSWTRVGDHVLLETDAHLRVFPLTRAWADLIARMQHRSEYTSGNKSVHVYYGTELAPKEIETLHTLCASVPEAIELTVADEVQSLVVHTKQPTRNFVVDLDEKAHSIQVTPTADYGGVWQSKIPEEIAHRHSGRTRYVRRDVFEHDSKSHIVQDGSGTLHYLRLHTNEEVAFYKEIETQYETLGFTKTLKCTRRGKTAVARYVQESWPALRSFAQAHGYEIVYAHDTLPTERVTFRADFTSDVDAEKDWLHFDVALYCGEERVTLDMLYAYMDSGGSYFRKDDGTLVEVENQAELERLVRLLKSFKASQEGGFEGKLHHAPELTYVMTSSPHYTGVQSKALQGFMKRVESGKPIKPVRLPKKISERLRPYQRAGVAWLYFLRSYRFAGILADDMGLGKTVQALTIMALERVPEVPSIVVCPKSLLYNWRQEATTFFPDLKVMVYDGTPQERQALRARIPEHDLIVVGYHTLKQDADTLLAPTMHYNYAILDEAQYIKNHATKLAQRVKEIPADYRLALTGTPLENHVFELWSMYDYLMPGFLGQHDHFATHYHRPIMEAGDQEALNHLRKKVESFMLRRTKSEVLTELPPKIEQTRECTLTEAQNVLYQQILAQVRGDVFGAVESKGFKSAQIHILAGLTKLRQACNHPALLTKDKDYDAYESAKLDACLELIDEVAQAGRKVLVFSQFTGMLDILAHALDARHTPYAYLSGKTRKRQEVIERFTADPTITAFLISMKAGGTGLNLTAADTVIIFDPWWNPSVENQAADRAHRIGQTQSVNVYRLLTKGTIEERIQALKERKQNLFNAVVNESGDLFKKLTWDDIRALFA